MLKLNESPSHSTSSLYHHQLTLIEHRESTLVWEKFSLFPFDELLISWSATRPHKGHFSIQVCVFTSEWSPWVDYALWGAQGQHSFTHEVGCLRSYQDTVQVMDGRQATGFKIRISAEQGATLKECRLLHVCTTLIKAHSLEERLPSAGALVDLAGLSQMTLPDSRALRLCSPTSLTAVIRHLLASETLCPLLFASMTHDSAFDIHGNWVLNTAQAAHELGDSWICYVARLSNLEQLIAPLHSGIPVVVSVQGSLPGATLPYESGHLLVVRGYDPTSKTILCMDPAYPSDSSTLVSYPWKDFLAAWNRRKGLSYCFEKNL